jgi:FAD/FMN-containing dehydrogenase
MWPAFYQLGTTGMGRNPPLDCGSGLYVLLETMGTDDQRDRRHFETSIGEALAEGAVRDAVITQSLRETNELWAVRDSPGEWEAAGHWPQLSFDVSVPTGEIGELVEEVEAELKSSWSDLTSLYFGHVADGNLHLSVSLGGRPLPALEIEDRVYGRVAQRNGSISAEHGIGTLKKPFLHLSRSAAEISLMRAIKHAMDPNGILNPGKIF